MTAGILGMEVVFGDIETPPKEATKNRAQKPSTNIERTTQLVLLKMASHQKFEAEIEKVLEGEPTDESAVKIWRLRCQQATMATLEGKPTP